MNSSYVGFGHETTAVSGRSCFVVLFVHYTRRYSVYKRKTSTTAHIHKRLNDKYVKSRLELAHTHGDLGSQEERGVLDELKPERNIAVKVSLTHTPAHAGKMPVDEARQYLHMHCNGDVAQHHAGFHGDTSRIIRSRGFTLLPKHKHVRNFAGVGY